MINIFSEMTAGINKCGFLYLPSWESEGETEGVFFRCSIQREHIISEIDRLFYCFIEDIGELAEYYRVTGAEIGSEPTLTEDSFFDEDVVHIWNDLFGAFSELEPGSDKYQETAKDIFGRGEAAVWALEFARRICRELCQGVDSDRRYLMITTEFAQALALSMCGASVGEICLRNGSKAH